MRFSRRQEPRPTPLASRAFRRLWLASVLSLAGDAASWVAMAALVLSSAHGSLPLLTVLYTAPVAVGGLAAGWALDRFDRRRLLAADAAVRGVVFAGIPVAAAAGSLGSTQVYATAAVYGLLKMISLAGFPALIPRLVDPGQQTAANALESAGFGVAIVAGPALAGVALGLGLPPAAVIAGDAATYLVFAATLAVTPLAPQAPDAQANHRQAPSAAIGEVVRLVIRHPVIRDTTVMFAAFNIGEGALLVVLADQARRAGFGPGGYGWLIAAMAAGELAAALVLIHVRWRAPLVVSVLAAQLAAAAVTTGLLSSGRAVTVTSLVLLGCCTAPMTAWAQTLRMQAAPSRMHGRLFALLRTAMQATPPVGALMAGITLRAGPDAAVASIVAAMAVPALLLAPDLLRPRRPEPRRLRRHKMEADTERRPMPEENA
jgi:MFS family permease